MFGWINRSIVSAHGSLVVVLLALLVVLVAVATLESVEEWTRELLGLSEKSEILKFLGVGMGGVLLALQAVIANRRAHAMEGAANAQAKATGEQARANRNTEQGQRQERLKNAIEHLGHESDSVRLGGAYELVHLAQDTREFRQTVLDILCAHIRRTTRQDEYKNSHISRPSEEVQSLLTLLFVEKHMIFQGLRANLQESWLNGANLQRACMQGASLTRVHLQEARLGHACLQGAVLVEACLRAASLPGAWLQGTNLGLAGMQGVDLSDARLEGAVLSGARLQASYLHNAHLQGADLHSAALQGATLSAARLQGAHLAWTYLQGATLGGTRLEGARCGNWSSSMSFAARMRAGVANQSDLSKTVLGGIEQGGVDALVEELLSDDQAVGLRLVLSPHVGKPMSFNLPTDSNAVTGAYTREEAERWTVEYEEAVLTAPPRSC